MEQSLNPGPDNILGNEDDISTPLSGYTREIEITEIVTNGVSNPNLRRFVCAFDTGGRSGTGKGSSSRSGCTS